MSNDSEPDHGMTIIFAKDWRTDNGLLKDSSHCSVSSEERSKWVDGIYLLYLDSLYPHHNQPITSLITISPLLSQPTGRSKDPHRYQYRCIVSLSWFSQPPMLMNLCSMFRFFLCHDCILSHLLFAIMTILLTVSPTLVTGGKGAWKPMKTSWVHCRLWLKVPATYPPITDWVHSKCSQIMCLT